MRRGLDNLSFLFGDLRRISKLNQKKKTDNVEISRLTLRESDDILFEILDSWQDGKKISLVSDMELVEYVATALLKDVEDISAEYIDFTVDLDEDEYFLTIDKNGWLCTGPLVDYYDLEKSDKVYIDLDVDVSDMTIDWCIDEDLHVTVFATDDDCDGDCENCEYDIEDKKSVEKESTTATYTVNGKKVSEEDYRKKLNEMDKKFQKHIQAVLDEYNGFIEDSKAWKKLFD